MSDIPDRCRKCEEEKKELKWIRYHTTQLSYPGTDVYKCSNGHEIFKTRPKINQRIVLPELSKDQQHALQSIKFSPPSKAQLKALYQRNFNTTKKVELNKS